MTVPTPSPRRRRGRATVLLVAALAIALLGCDSGGDDATTTDAVTTGAAVSSGPTPTDPSATEPTEPTPTDAADTTTPDTAAPTTEAAPDTTTVVPAGWEQIVPGGDCQCADGSEFSFWVRPADPTKVVLYFQGGGACFSAESCAFTGGTYKSTAGLQDDPTGGAGVLDFTDPRNPLADYSWIYVPYCTGDVHIGDAATAYSPELTVQHRGAVNAAAALDYLATTFPDAEQVVVTGESAGGVATPLYGGEVSDLLPDADVIVLADSSGAYPDVPGINALIGSVWGTVNAIPPWPENAGQTAETWSLPGLFVQAGRHDPDITFARHDYAFDQTQAFFAQFAGIAADQLVTLIDGNEAQIEAAGVPVASYVAPGTSHTVLSTSDFYTETVNGVPFVDWVTALVDGEPVTDNHCVECTA